MDTGKKPRLLEGTGAEIKIRKGATVGAHAKPCGDFRPPEKTRNLRR